eukprot:1161460-Prorocentrum_minimum.AAC.1
MARVPGTNCLLTGSYDKTVRLWNGMTGEEKGMLHKGGAGCDWGFPQVRVSSPRPCQNPNPALPTLPYPLDPDQPRAAQVAVEPPQVHAPPDPT